MRQLAAIQTPVILIALLAAIASTSLLTSDEALQVTLTEMFIRVIAVVGLYVFIGNSGIISFGHIAFMCIGAYAAGWATAEPTFKQIMLSGLPEFLKQGQYPFLAAIGGAMALPARRRRSPPSLSSSSSTASTRTGTALRPASAR